MEQEDSPFTELAPDAWLDPPRPDDLMGHTLGIKALMLDQKRCLSGVGNWIADEVLYQSRIHPDQNYLTAAQSSLLLTKLKEILKVAVDGDLKEDLPEEWLFNFRWSKGKSKKSVITDYYGKNISFVTSGGRTSAIVPSIQKRRSQKTPQKLAAANSDQKRKPKGSHAPTNESANTAGIKSKRKRKGKVPVPNDQADVPNDRSSKATNTKKARETHIANIMVDEQVPRRRSSRLVNSKSVG